MTTAVVNSRSPVRRLSSATNSPGFQLAFGPGLVIHDSHLAGQDHDEVVAVISLPEQDVTRRRRPDLPLPAQQGDLPLDQPQLDQRGGSPLALTPGCVLSGRPGGITFACHGTP